MTTFLDGVNALLKGAEAAPLLDEFLKGFAERFPDSAPEVDALLTKMGAALPPEAEGLVAELKKFAETRSLNPRPSPSNIAG